MSTITPNYCENLSKSKRKGEEIIKKKKEEVIIEIPKRKNVTVCLEGRQYVFKPPIANNTELRVEKTPAQINPSNSECISLGNGDIGDTNGDVFNNKNVALNYTSASNDISTIKSSIYFDNNYKRLYFYIFFSICCSTGMVKLATKIRTKMESNYQCSIFLCTTDAINAFYDTITAAIKNCCVFVPFIDIGWCESNECGDETNMALNLSRHTNPRKPVIMPIVFKQDGVKDHGRCLQLISTWNGIFLETNQFEDDNYIYEQLSKQLNFKM